MLTTSFASNDKTGWMVIMDWQVIGFRGIVNHRISLLIVFTGSTEDPCLMLQIDASHPIDHTRGHIDNSHTS